MPDAPQTELAQTSVMRRRAVISLTPLIDVVFILLVFFMLASSFLDWRALDLSVGKAGGAGNMGGAMLLEVRAGDMRLGGRTVSEDELMEALASRVQRDPAQRLLVKPEPGVQLQRAIDLVDRIAATGLRDVTFVTPGGTP